MAAYERWSAATAAKPDAAGKARAELGRREAETPDLMDWWRTFEADVDAVDRAIGRQRQAAAEAGHPWPPRPGPQPTAEPEATSEVPGPDAEPPEAEDELEGPTPVGEPAAGSNEPAASVEPEPEPEAADGGRAARLDALQAKADEAAARIRADRQAQAEADDYYARAQAEAQREAGPEVSADGGQGSVPSYEMEPEA
jgi:hypothetical protein